MDACDGGVAPNGGPGIGTPAASGIRGTSRRFALSGEGCQVGGEDSVGPWAEAACDPRWTEGRCYR